MKAWTWTRAALEVLPRLGKLVLRILGVKVFWKTWNKVLVDMIWNTVCHEFIVMLCLILLLVILWWFCFLSYCCCCWCFIDIAFLYPCAFLYIDIMYHQAYCRLEVRASQFQGDSCSDRQPWSLKIWILDTAGETEICSEQCWKIHCACNCSRMQ